MCVSSTRFKLVPISLISNNVEQLFLGLEKSLDNFINNFNLLDELESLFNNLFLSICILYIKDEQ